jgi:hypothetical protein
MARRVQATLDAQFYRHSGEFRNPEMMSLDDEHEFGMNIHQIFLDGYLLKNFSARFASLR